MSESERIAALERRVAELERRLAQVESDVPGIAAGTIIAIRELVGTLERWRVLPAEAVNVDLRLYRARLSGPELPEDWIVRGLIELPPDSRPVHEHARQRHRRG